MNWIDKSLDLHARALLLRSERANVLAGNIANSETPDFKARDMEFQSLLESAADQDSGVLVRTNEKHLADNETKTGGQLVYRVPVQEPRNGNTVELEVEKSAYTQTAIRYQASAEFLDGTIRGMLLAIRGQ